MIQYARVEEVKEMFIDYLDLRLCVWVVRIWISRCLIVDVMCRFLKSLIFSYRMCMNEVALRLMLI